MCACGDGGSCKCVPELSVGFAVRAWIGVILVQLVVMIISMFLCKILNIDPAACLYQYAWIIGLVGIFSVFFLSST